MRPRAGIRAGLAAGAALLLAGAVGAGPPTFLFRERLGLKHHCPTLAELGDGSLLAAWYYGGTHHGESDVGGAILGAVKRRGRRGWSEPFVLHDSYRDAEGNPVLFWNPATRRLHLVTGTMRQDPRWDSLTTHWLRAPVAGARDLAPRAFRPVPWEAPRTLAGGRFAAGAPAAGDRGFVLRNRPLALGDRFVLPLYRHGADPGLATMELDAAREAWGPLRFVPAPGAEQAALADLGGGRVLLVARNTAGTPGSRAWVARSVDGGRTFGPLAPHPDLPNENGSLDLATLPDGRVVAVLNPARDRRRLELYLSEDGGERFRPHRVLEDEPDGEYSYPTLVLGRDGRDLHLVYSYCRRTIAYRRLPVASLGARP